VECDACMFTTETTAYEYIRRGLTYTAHLCAVCASSVSGTAYMHPHSYENRHVIHMIAFSTNMMLKEMRNV
jgi:hypothetical protein